MRNLDPRDVLEYRMLSAIDPGYLANDVQKLLDDDEGWVMHGSPMVAASSSLDQYPIWAQAMVKVSQDY